MPETSWFIYIVECNDGSLYTGITKDVAARISAHNKGRGAKYTRARLPVQLVFQESADNQGDALRREYAIKQLTAPSKRQLISKNPAK